MAKFLPLARLRPDVVQFEWNLAAVDHLPLFGVWGCPVLTSCRGSDITVYPHVPSLSGYLEQLPEVMRRASAVHCVSESLRTEALRFGLEADKAWIIPPAVDTDLFRPEAGASPIGAEALRVVSIAGMRWEKGHEYALAAIRAVLDSGVEVSWELIGAAREGSGGPPPEQQRIRAAIAELGLTDRVSLRPRAGAPEIVRRLARADVLLHSSLSEGIPNVVLEAMACTVPVVATRCGGISEAVRDGVEGLLVPPREPEALADALRRLWREPRLRAAMGDAGRQRVCERFAVGDQIQAFLAMYASVAA